LINAKKEKPLIAQRLFRLPTFNFQSVAVFGILYGHAIPGDTEVLGIFDDGATASGEWLL